VAGFCLIEAWGRVEVRGQIQALIVAPEFGEYGLAAKNQGSVKSQAEAGQKFPCIAKIFGLDVPGCWVMKIIPKWLYSRVSYSRFDNDAGVLGRVVRRLRELWRIFDGVRRQAKLHFVPQVLICPQAKKKNNRRSLSTYGRISRRRCQFGFRRWLV